MHEALIRRWQTLRQWVDEEREFLVWQEKLRVLLGQWVESGKDEGAVLRGLPLDEALRWRETHTVHLANGEREFIAASEQLRKQTRKAKEKQRQRNITSLVVGLVIAVLLSLFSIVQWRNADQKTAEVKKEKNRAEQQTLEANYNLAKVFEKKALAVLKNAQGDHCNQTYQQAVLFTSAALEQKIEENKFALKLGSIGRLFTSALFDAALAELWASSEPGVNSIAFSPDGRILASASSDKVIRLWDMEKGKEIKELKGHKDGVISVTFSPDGTRLASTSYDKIIRLWNIESGKETSVFKGHTNSINDLIFRPSALSELNFRVNRF